MAMARQTPWQYLATNADSVPIMAGMPVCQIPDVGTYRAHASSYAHAQISGIVIAGESPTNIYGALPTLRAQIVVEGLIGLPSILWRAVTEYEDGLQPGLDYFLGLVPGTMTTTPPSSPGQFVVKLGTARSSTLFSFSPQTAILL